VREVFRGWGYFTVIAGGYDKIEQMVKYPNGFS